jgi:hypothetical protein
MRFRRGAGGGVRTQVRFGQFVGSFGAAFEVGCELVGAQAGAFLNPDAVRQEQSQVGGDHEVPGGFAFRDNVESVRARILVLLESQVPEFHYHPFFAVAGRDMWQPAGGWKDEAASRLWTGPARTRWISFCRF